MKKKFVIFILTFTTLIADTCIEGTCSGNKWGKLKSDKGYTIESYLWTGLLSSIPNGNSILRFDDGSYIKVNYINEKKEGSAQVFTKDNVKIEDFTYVNDSANGKSIRYFSDGNYLKANYENGKLQGAAQVFTKDNVKIEDFIYVNGLANGESTQYFSDGRYLKFNYINDKGQGPAQFFTKDNFKIEDFTYVNGSANGESIEYMPNGNYEKRTYKNGKLQGAAQVFTKDNVKIEDFIYVDGSKNGEAYFFPKEDVPVKFTYDKNIPKNLVFNFSSGIKLTADKLVGDILFGHVKYFDKHDNKLFDKTIKEEDDSFESYNTDGSKVYGILKNKKINGYLYAYDFDEDLSIIQYEENRKIKNIKFDSGYLTKDIKIQYSKKDKSIDKNSEYVYIDLDNSCLVEKGNLECGKIGNIQDLLYVPTDKRNIKIIPNYINNSVDLNIKTNIKIKSIELKIKDKEAQELTILKSTNFLCKTKNYEIKDTNYHLKLTLNDDAILQYDCNKDMCSPSYQEKL